MSNKRKQSNPKFKAKVALEALRCAEFVRLVRAMGRSDDLSMA